MYPRSRSAPTATFIALLAGCSSSSPERVLPPAEASAGTGGEVPGPSPVAPLPGPRAPAAAVPQRIFSDEITLRPVPGQPAGVGLGMGFEGYLALADGDGRVRWANRIFVNEMDTRDAVSDGSLVGITPELDRVLVSIGYGSGDATLLFAELGGSQSIRAAETEGTLMSVTGARDLGTVALRIMDDDGNGRFELRDSRGALRCTFPDDGATEAAFTTDGRYVFVGDETEWSDVRNSATCEPVDPWPAEDPHGGDSPEAPAARHVGLPAEEADPMQVSNVSFVDAGVRLRTRYRSYVLGQSGVTSEDEASDVTVEAPLARESLEGLRVLASDEGTRIAVGLEDCDDCEVPRLVTVDLRTGRRGVTVSMNVDLRESEYSEEERTTFAFSPDGRYGIAYPPSAEALLIDLRRGRITRRFQADEWARFADAGHVLFGKAGAIRLMPTAGGRATTIEAHAELVDVSNGLVLTTTAYGPDADYVLRRVAGGERLTVHGRGAAFDARGHAFVQQTEGFERIDPTTFERTHYPGYRLASLGDSVLYCSAGVMSLRAGGAEPRDFGACPVGAAEVAVRPDGKSIAIWSEGVLQVLRADDGSRVDVAMLGRLAGMTAVAFDDDGSSALVAGEADDFLIRERGPLFTAALRPVGRDEALLRRLAHVLEP